MTRSTFFPLGIVAALVVLVADQASKWWILNVLDLPDLRQVVLLPVLNLTMVWNHGVTFGLLNGLGDWGHVILAAVALAVVVALWFWLRRLARLPGARSAMSSTGCASVGWWISSMPMSTRPGATCPGMCSMSPTRPSSAGWRC
jgi:lipoprotein signal peptidase